MTWNKDDYVKEGYFYVKPIDTDNPDQRWASQRFGVYFINLGDLIYDTMRKIKEDDDKSYWAKESLIACRDLLKERKLESYKKTKSNNQCNTYSFE